MNTLISIVMAIVLNFLGVEVQERKLAANAQNERIEQTNAVQCTKISAYGVQKTIVCKDDEISAKKYINQKIEHTLN